MDLTMYGTVFLASRAYLIAKTLKGHDEPDSKV